MNHLAHYFEIANYLVFGTFFLIFLEFSYSLYKKDGVYTVPGTAGNILNAIVMKLLLANVSIASYVGYLVLIEKKIPHGENFEQYGILSYLVCIIFIDLSFYWYHRAHHYFYILWPIHFTHHSDDTLNLSTSYRMSLIEKTYNSIIVFPVILLGFDPYFALFCFYLTSIYQFFNHSNYITYPKIFDTFLSTPNNHRVHHHQVFANHGINFGGVFSIWDKIFGTYQEPDFIVLPGISGYHQDNFVYMQTDPILDYFRTMHRSLKLKIKKFF